jgi:hypothetical protein
VNISPSRDARCRRSRRELLMPRRHGQARWRPADTAMARPGECSSLFLASRAVGCRRHRRLAALPYRRARNGGRWVLGTAGISSVGLGAYRHFWTLDVEGLPTFLGTYCSVARTVGVMPGASE